MPRHDRAYGATVPTKKSGGGSARRGHSSKNTYRTKQHIRRTVDELAGKAASPAAQASPPAEAEAAQRRQQVGDPITRKVVRP